MDEFSESRGLGLLRQGRRRFNHAKYLLDVASSFADAEAKARSSAKTFGQQWIGWRTRSISKKRTVHSTRQANSSGRASDVALLLGMESIDRTALWLWRTTE